MALAEPKNYRIIERAGMFVVQKEVVEDIATCMDAAGNWLDVSFSSHERLVDAEAREKYLRSRDPAQPYKVVGAEDPEEVELDEWVVDQHIECFFDRLSLACSPIETVQVTHPTEGLEHSKMCRNRPYTGQDHTDYGVRGSYLVSDITFRDLRDCFVRAACLSTGLGYWYAKAKEGDAADLCENDLYKLNWDKINPVAMAQNLSCEVERVMGIFPNLETQHPTEGLERDEEIIITGIDSATDQEAMNACATDLLRRVKADELIGFIVTAMDTNGNILEYDPTKSLDIGQDDEPD